MYRSPVIKSQYLSEEDAPKTAKVIRYLEDDAEVILEDHEDGLEEEKGADQAAETAKADLEAIARLKEAKEEAETFVEEVRAEAEANLARASEEAARILEEARTQSRKTSDEAVKAKEETLRKAHEEGFAKGYQEGVAKGLEETQGLVVAAGTIVGEVKAHKRDAMKIAESQILQLSMAIAARVVRFETRINAGVVINTVREALKAVDDKENLKIFVNPEDLETVTSHRDEFLNIVRGVKELQILTDTSLTRGGCVIQTNLGNIDAQVETALGIIDNELKRINSSRDE